MSVELDNPFGPGGAVFEWNLVDVPFYLRYHELSGWLDRMTELLAAGEFDRRDGPDGPVLVLNDPHTSVPMSELPAPTTPNPVHGEVTRYERHPLKWPLHWQRLSRIEPEDVKPRGATCTIAEVFAAHPDRTLEVTVAGRVVALGGYGDRIGVRVSDGTGSLAIVCPIAVTALGPVMGKSFEFDVVASGGEATATAVRPLDAP